jgi:hypothetical protein
MVGFIVPFRYTAEHLKRYIHALLKQDYSRQRSAMQMTPGTSMIHAGQDLFYSAGLFMGL